MRLKKWNQAWKTRLIQEKNPSVDHCDTQWIPAFAGMTGEIFAGMTGEIFAGMAGEIFAGMAGEIFAGMAGEIFAGTHDCVVIDLSLSFPRRRESIEAHPE